MVKILHHLNYYFVVVAFFILGFYLLDPYPNSWGTDHNSIFKYFPVFLIHLGFFLNLFFYISKIDRVRFSIGLFLLIMFLGSCYTILISGNDLDETFIGRSLIALTFINFITLLNFRRYVSYFKLIFLYFFAFYTLWVFVCLLLKQTIGFFDVKHIFHEEIILTTSSSILFFSYFRSIILKFIFVSISILTGFLTFKITASLS